MADVKQLPDDAPASAAIFGSDEEFAKEMGMEKWLGSSEQPAPKPAIKKEAPVKKEPEPVKEEIVEEEVVEEEQVVEEEPAVPPQEDEEVEEEVKEELEPEKKEETEKDEKPLTQFTMFDETGEEVEVPKVFITLKANNKVHEKVPIDKVVLLAQMGFYNEEREEQVRGAKYFVNELLQREEQYKSVVNELSQELDTLLSDEEYYGLAREEHAKQRSPEARASRAERQLQEKEQTARQEREAAQAAAYVKDKLYPIAEKLLKDYSDMVSEDAVFGKFSRIVTPYMVNGRVPAANLPKIEADLQREFGAWATSLSVERDNKTKDSKAEKVKRQRELTLAKRKVARATKPSGSVPKKDAKKPKSYESVTDWLNDVENIASEGLK